MLVEARYRTWLLLLSWWLINWKSPHSAHPLSGVEAPRGGGGAHGWPHLQQCTSLFELPLNISCLMLYLLATPPPPKALSPPPLKPPHPLHLRFMDL